MKKEYTPVTKAPTRQGFYLASMANGDEHVAEWREHDKKLGKRWYRWTAASPTEEKTPVLLDDVVGYAPASKEQVAQALAREKTEDELIEEAANAYRRHIAIYRDYANDAPPAHRQLAVGDKVLIGALEETTVARVFDEGRFVVIRYRRTNNNYGKPVRSGILYGAWHWTQLVKAPEKLPLPATKESGIFNAFRTSTLESLLNKRLDGLNPSPDYQRDYVWSDADKHLYLESVFAGRDLGRFVFVTHPHPQCPDILDGKQRLDCLWAFFTSRLAFQGVYWHELHPRDRDRIENRSVQYAELSSEQVSRSELLHIFLELNAGGVPQSQEHLSHVRALLAAENSET